MLFKLCNICNETKPVTEFHASHSGKYGVRSYCKSCKQKSYSKAVRKSWSRLEPYGLTQDDLDKMRISQANSCAICGKLDPSHIDHCHKTGRVRGLLCQPCNNGLGMFRDDPDILKAAIDYLK